MTLIDQTLVGKIVSGGQTGADRAALDWAIDHDVPHGGWCPKGRRAEDGVLPAAYRLTETGSEDYRVRTAQNVRDSDGTLVVNAGTLEGGTRLTVQIAEDEGKPFLVVQLEDGHVGGHAETVRDWINRYGIRVLNLAGPRGSKQPAIYERTRALLDAAFAAPDPDRTA